MAQNWVLSPGFLIPGKRSQLYTDLLFLMWKRPPSQGFARLRPFRPPLQSQGLPVGSPRKHRMPLWEAQESGEYRTPVTAPGADGRAPCWHSDPLRCFLHSFAVCDPEQVESFHPGPGVLTSTTGKLKILQALPALRLPP